MKFVFLWTDYLLYLLVVLAGLSAWWSLRHEHLRAPWRQVMKNRLGVISLLILSLYVGVALVDSVHIRLAEPSSSSGIIHYSTQTKSLLDVVLGKIGHKHEKTYSAPMATELYVKESIRDANNQVTRQHVRLKQAALSVNKAQSNYWQIVLSKAGRGALVGLGVWIVLMGLISWLTKPCSPTAFVTSLLLFVGIGCAYSLGQQFHLFGTDKIGQDVFYQGMKGIRTGLIIGTLTTLVMLPFAVSLGLAAGYFGGLVDDIIQYCYTTLSSIPGVLLIAAAILSLQVYLANHPDAFPTMTERADMRLLALCCILGVTSWTGLCRIIRAETLKLRELDYIQAAKILGVGRFKLLLRHLLPNVMHLIIIAIVLDFRIFLKFSCEVVY